MFASPSFNIVRAVWMLLEEDKAPKVRPISICVSGIEVGLKQPPVYSKLRVCSFFQFIAAAQHVSRLFLACFAHVTMYILFTLNISFLFYFYLCISIACLPIRYTTDLFIDCPFCRCITAHLLSCGTT